LSARILIPLVALLAAVFAPPADAALRWHTVRTLEYVRGVPQPQAAIDGTGKAAVVYSQADVGDASKVRLLVRPPGATGEFFEPALIPGQTAPRVAVNPSGAMAIATVDDGRLEVVLYPAPGPKPTEPWGAPEPVKLSIESAGYSVARPQIAIDGAGVATVVWVSPPGARSYTPNPPPSRVYTTTISPPGVVAPVQELAGPGVCAPKLDANLRGDAVVAAGCDATEQDIFFRPAGGLFGPGESVPGMSGDPSNVTIDGTGDVLAFHADQAYYSVRPRLRSFGVPVRMPGIPSGGLGLLVDSQEDGRTVAAWTAGNEAFYSTRQPGGDFGPPTVLPGAQSLSGLVAAPAGPVLFWWRGGNVRTLGTRLMTSILSTDGPPTRPTPVSAFAGDDSSLFAPSFAIDQDGRAVGAWEQRCEGGGFAVMTVVRDESGEGRAQPPCQDTRPPKVIAPGKRAILAKRTVRMRLACSESCRFTVRSRILRAGQRKPIALAKTDRERRLGARRGGWLKLTLSGAETRRLAVALRRGQKVTARLAVSVRDTYGNGRTWRLGLPVRR
jgi:hypothetical protein